PTRRDDRHRARRIEQIPLDEVVNGDPKNGGRQERDDDAKSKPARLRFGREADQRAPELVPIDDDHGQNGAELDDDGEDLPILLGETKEVLGHQEVRCRRYGKEFRETFNDPEDERLDQLLNAWHGPSWEVAEGERLRIARKAGVTVAAS